MYCAKNINKPILILLCLIIALSSCKKEWLDAKSDVALVVPATLKDLQALLDNNLPTANVFNVAYPYLGEFSADNYYLRQETWQSLGLPISRNSYIWADEFYGGNDYSQITDWSASYQRVFYANVVLDKLSNIDRTPTNQGQWDNVKGSALFCRAFDFYNLAQEFCKVYDDATSSTDLGVLLKISADINEKTSRASVEETYNQIITDLQHAIQLLPVTSVVKTRPSKPAAYALLAKTYLTMRKYDKALSYSDSTLQISSALMNYNGGNGIGASGNYRFSRFNPEVIYECVMFPNSQNLQNSIHIVDTTLFSSYSDNDLRKSLFYRVNGGFTRFYGSYIGSSLLFCGLATDEVYLTRAECFARLGNRDAALSDLNTLMINRWKSSVWIPITAQDAHEALNKILDERRKELVFRGVRWADLRRLNKEGRSITLTRVLGNQTFTLSPNSNRYVFPIPEEEVKINGIVQNPR